MTRSTTCESANVHCYAATASIALLALVLTLVPGSVAIAQTNNIRYVYDDSGRLVAVIDATGETAVYHYDAVGNLLSITRESASTAVKIVFFSPTSGPVGTTVRIAGTGFSAVAAQNTVTFNGTAGTIISATTTELIASVPQGASTGSIAVTTPAGPATSSAPFTVAASTAPTVTGFSPTIGTAGTSVTINGANFDPIFANDRALFGLKPSTLTGASATSLNSSVPSGAGTDHIKVVTPIGSATSVAHFFVPPQPFTAADVTFTADMAFGDTGTVTINTSNKIALIAFDATAGQRVTFQFTNTTITPTALALTRPTGATVMSTTLWSSASFIETVVPDSGAYMLMLDPWFAGTGSMTLALNTVSDVSGTIVPGGSAVTVTTTLAGQNARLTFSGTAGQRVSVTSTNNTIAQSTFSLVKPDGSTQFSGEIYGGNGTGFMDVETLAVAGTYSLFVDPSGTNTGSVTLTLYDVPADVSGSITAGGSSLTVTTTVPGQNARLTFTGTAGQRVSVTSTNNTIAQSTFSLVKPDGSTQFSGAMYGGNGTGFMDVQTLAGAGTYALSVDPNGTNTGSVTLRLYDVPADISGPITPGGSPVTATATVPGQNVRLSFSGTAGQRISVTSTNNTIAESTFSVVKPDGTNLFSGGMYGGNGTGFMDVQTLPVAGTYTIVVDPSGTNTGSVTLTLYDVLANPTATVTIGGSSATLTMSVPGQNGSVTFAGTAGQQATVHITNNTIGWTGVTLLKPDGSSLTSASWYASSFDLATQTLPTTGTYTVSVDPSGTGTGSISVNVTTP